MEVPGAAPEITLVSEMPRACPVEWLCLKSQKSVLETVSTTCDSGWVDAQHAKFY
jgi:hypothetical protein